jgi:hypothetical protein
MDGRPYEATLMHIFVTFRRVHADYLNIQGDS